MPINRFLVHSLTLHSKRMYAENSPNHRSATHLIPTPDRSKRVKDAKNEAQKEIEEYRKQKDDEFKEFEKKVHTPSATHARSKHRS